MSAWNGTMKWCIRNCEEEGPVDLNELKYLLMAEDNTDEFDTSALHLACVGNNAAIIKLLIAYNVPVNGTDKDGATPLHWACSKGNLDSVIALLHAKADIKATDYGMYIFLLLSILLNIKFLFLFFRWKFYSTLCCSRGTLTHCKVYFIQI